MPASSFDQSVWERLVNLLNSSSPIVREEAIWALDRRDRRTLWDTPGVVQRLLQLLKSDDDDCGAADKVLCHLQYAEEDGQPAPVELNEILHTPGWMETLVEAMRDKDEYNKVHKCMMFFHGLSRLPTSEQQALLLRVTALLNTGSPGQQLGAARALHRLADLPGYAPTFAAMPNELQGVVALLHSQSAERQVAAVRVLVDMAQKVPTFCNWMVAEHGLVMRLAAVLSSNTLSKDTSGITRREALTELAMLEVPWFPHKVR
jgi:hypothetical protein